MGLGSIGAAFVLLFMIAALAILLVVAIVLLLVYGARRRAGAAPSRWLLRTAIALIAVVLAVPIVGILWGSASADPDTLTLDLRETIAEKSLPGEEMPGFPGFYDYDSERVELRLPQGKRLGSPVTKAAVTVEDGVADSVSLRGPAESPKRAAERAAEWAKGLELETSGLEDAADSSSTEWTSEAAIGNVATKLSLQPVKDGELMIARLRFELSE
ncbi:MAG: Adenine deaminase-related protein [Thermoleophilia bacterium]|nr:Adenine deaminase-related protein [Thermoleophilia bacterium]